MFEQHVLLMLVDDCVAHINCVTHTAEVCENVCHLIFCKVAFTPNLSRKIVIIPLWNMKLSFEGCCNVMKLSGDQV